MMSTRHDAPSVDRWLLGAILLLSLIMRGMYVLRVPVTHDEYASLWAARHVWEHGIPQLPSGFVYWQGWLFTYLAAPIELLVHPPAWLLRLPGLLVGLASVVLVYRLGLMMVGRAVGLIAAFGWSLTPVAIVAGGQARMYAFLDLFSLLALVLLLRWLRQGRLVDGWTFAVAVLGALASQPVALLILPGLALVTLLDKGWRWWRQPKRWFPWGACATGGFGTLLLNRWGGPVTSATRRPYLAFGWPWQKVGLVLTIRELLGNAQGWLIAAGLLAGLILLSRELRARRAGPVTLLYAAWLPGFLLFAVAIGETWQRARYIQMLLPFALLIVATVIWRAVERWRDGIPAMAAGATLALLWLLPAVSTVQMRGLDHQAAYTYIRANRRVEQKGEVVLTGLPVVAGYYLGKADGYALQRDYEEYVVMQDGDPVDRWTGAPLLTSAWGFGGVVADVPGAWFVVSAERLPMLYSPDFVTYLDEIMEPVFQGGGLIVYHTRDGHQDVRRAERPAIWIAAGGEKPAYITLIGYELAPRHPAPGDTLHVALHWQTNAQLQHGLIAFVHVLDDAGNRVAQADRPPADGILTTRWPVGQPVRGHFTIPLPTDLPPGEYQLLVGLYDPDTLQRLPLQSASGPTSDDALTLDFVTVIDPEARVPQ